MPGDCEVQKHTLSEICSENQEWLNIINKVIESGLPNAFGLRIQINHAWNFELLQSLLGDYADKVIIHF